MSEVSISLVMHSLLISHLYQKIPAASWFLTSIDLVDLDITPALMEVVTMNKTLFVSSKIKVKSHEEMLPIQENTFSSNSPQSHEYSDMLCFLPGWNCLKMQTLSIDDSDQVMEMDSYIEIKNTISEIISKHGRILELFSTRGAPPSPKYKVAVIQPNLETPTVNEVTAIINFIMSLISSNNRKSDFSDFFLITKSPTKMQG